MSRETVSRRTTRDPERVLAQLKLLGGSQTPTRIAVGLGMTTGRVRNALAKLKLAGKVAVCRKLASPGNVRAYRVVV